MNERMNEGNKSLFACNCNYDDLQSIARSKSSLGSLIRLFSVVCNAWTYTEGTYFDWLLKA